MNNISLIIRRIAVYIIFPFAVSWFVGLVFKKLNYKAISLLDDANPFHYSELKHKIENSTNFFLGEYYSFNWAYAGFALLAMLFLMVILKDKFKSAFNL